MHCGVDFDEPVDAAVSGGEVTVEREADRQTAVAAATRGASSADAGYEESARTLDAVEAPQHHESPADAPGLAETVTGDRDGESAESLLAPLFTFFDRGEWRRLAVIAGVPLAVALTVRSATADLAWLVVTASLLLGVSLLRRVRARETVADAALGAGAITLAVIGFDAVQSTFASGLGGGVASLAGAWPALPVALAAAVAGWTLRK
jgi:hypothetical protein